MSKCIGCGVLLQYDDINKDGYTSKNDSILCERCFRIQNYNEYKKVEKNNDNYIEILKKINETNDLVLLVVDLFNFNNIDNIKKYINNNIILVLTKRDLLPKGIYEQKLLDYFSDTNLNIVDKIIISSVSNYNLDDLYFKINKYKTSKNVYVIGYTSAGKSTLINKLIYNYSDLNKVITTSILPSTTLDMIDINLNENLTIIDTPGLLVENSITDYVDEKMYKKIVPKKTIKPIIYQIKSYQNFIIDDLLRVDIEPYNDIVFYFSKDLNIKRSFKNNEKLKDLEKHVIKVDDKEDIVINGLGFIKIMHQAEVTLYTIKGVSVYKRKSFL